MQTKIIAKGEGGKKIDVADETDAQGVSLRYVWLQGAGDMAMWEVEAHAGDVINTGTYADGMHLVIADRVVVRLKDHIALKDRELRAVSARLEGTGVVAK